MCTNKTTGVVSCDTEDCALKYLLIREDETYYGSEFWNESVRLSCYKLRPGVITAAAARLVRCNHAVKHDRFAVSGIGAWVIASSARGKFFRLTGLTLGNLLKVE